MNPRRYSQIERALNVLDRSVTTHLLKEDQYLLFLLKKTERIVAALYVVTNSFHDPEPLKWSIRESGTLLIKHVLSLRERMTMHTKEFLSDTFAEITRLLSLLDLAHIADLLSPMNSSVLRNELDGLVNIFENKWRASSLSTHAPSLEKSFFGIPRNILSDTKEDQGKTLTHNHQNMEPNTEEGAALYAFGDFERFLRGLKDTHKGQGDTVNGVLNEKARTFTQKTRIDNAGMSFRSPLKVHAGAKGDRMQDVIAVLKKQNNNATIRDFSTVVKGCSEKTIQRLLIEMVRKGVLKRSGSRRWSRYSIVEERRIV